MGSRLYPLNLAHMGYDPALHFFSVRYREYVVS